MYLFGFICIFYVGMYVCTYVCRYVGRSAHTCTQATYACSYVDRCTEMCDTQPLTNNLGAYIMRSFVVCSIATIPFRANPACSHVRSQVSEMQSLGASRTEISPCFTIPRELDLARSLSSDRTGRQSRQSLFMVGCIMSPRGVPRRRALYTWTNCRVFVLLYTVYTYMHLYMVCRRQSQCHVPASGRTPGHQPPASGQGRAASDMQLPDRDCADPGHADLDPDATATA